MAVLINGIEMPKGTDEHRLIIRANGQVIIDKKTYWEEAKAVPVPPHGRLIDADALSKSFEKTANYYYEHNSEVSSSFWSGGEICTEWYAVEDLLENAPTIIEADPAEEGK